MRRGPVLEVRQTKRAAIRRTIIPVLRRKRLLPIAMLSLSLFLGPYVGPPLNASIPGTSKFLVTVRGRAGQRVILRAVDVPAGYVASFCTDRVCAPFRVELALPYSGRQAIELQLIANEPNAREPRTVVVTANRSQRAAIAFKRATHL